MADIAALTEELKTLLLAQHDSERGLAWLKSQMKDPAKVIEELSDQLDALYRATDG
jgi:hypothetical protein